ncbi:glycosyltransferase [bacterium 1XD21-13]|nr:glycosyltransferase [bacterium 1XD21-13]
MEGDITISVVIPVYNGEKFIERTLDSMFSQSVLPDELIIVDDGSTDGTVEKIEKYFNTHVECIKNKKLLKQKNEGAGAARNKGIVNSHGNWISFMDSDDIWDRDKIKYTYQAIMEHPEAVIISHDMYIVTNGNYEKKQYAALHQKYSNNSTLFVQLYHGGFLPTPCVTIKKNLLEKVGMFDPSLRSCQDYDLWLKCSLEMDKHENLYIMDRALYTYIVRKGSISYDFKKRYKYGMTVLRRYRKYLSDYMENDEACRYARKCMNIFVLGEVYSALKKRKLFSACRLLVQYMKDL